MSRAVRGGRKHGGAIPTINVYNLKNPQTELERIARALMRKPDRRVSHKKRTPRLPTFNLPGDDE